MYRRSGKTKWTEQETDKPSTSETSEEVADGEANAANISLVNSCNFHTTVHPTRNLAFILSQLHTYKV